MSIFQEKTRKKPVRSRYPFPSYNLGIARQIAEKIEYEGAGRLSEVTLAMTLHVSVKSSGFKLKLLAARQFQLLTRQGEMLSTTPLAKAIFKPTTEEEKRGRMIEAFMAIPLFNAVATRFRGQPLPTGQSFRNILEREFGVENNRVSEAERVLTDSAREAGLLHDSGGKTYLATENVPMPQPRTVSVAPEEVFQPTQQVTTLPTGSLFTISEQDLADFDDKDFDDIWRTLGKIARVRGKRQRAKEESIPTEEIEEEDKE